MTKTPVFFVDKTDDRITSYCVGNLWVYHFHEALVAVHSHEAREFFALDPEADLQALLKDRLTPGILTFKPEDLTTIKEDISADIEPVLVGATELESNTLRLVAHQVQSLIDSALFPS